jgi:hypothetical protein
MATFFPSGNYFSNYSSNPYQSYSSPVYSGKTLVGYDTGKYSLPVNQNTGSVLGASTSSDGGSFSGSNQTFNSGSQTNQPQEPSQSSMEDQMRGNIENTYSGYENYLNQILSGLNPQAEAQRGTINNQYQQGYNMLSSQLAQGQADLGEERIRTEKSQAKSMKDLASAMRNQFISGQVALGAKGAGDSSAANQYSYALTKMGNQQRGNIASQTADIMREIGGREFKLKNVYDTEIKNIALERDSQLNQVAQWLSEQQNSIKQLLAEGQLRKGQDLNSLAMNAYNQAIQMANQANTVAQNKTAALQSWAMGNASNIQQLRQNMAGIADYTANTPSFTGLNTNIALGGSRNNIPVYGGGYNTDEYQSSIV